MRYLRSGAPTLGLALFFLLLSSCGGDSPTTPPAAVPGSLTLAAGDAQSGVVGAVLGTPLSAVVKDTNGGTMSGVAVTWTVTTGGGSVSQASTTTGGDGSASVTWTLGGSAGAQSVTATAASFSVTFSATADAGPAAQVVVTAASTTLEALEATVQLSATVADQFGNPVAGAGDVTWVSADTTVVAVGADGVATAVSNGAADVTATVGSLSGEATLTVAQKATSVAVTPENPVTSIGGTAQLSASGEDANGFAVAGGAFTWTSSDAAVATVDSTGLVTGVAEGTATITATSGGVSGTATVTVTAAPFEPTADTEISGTLNVAQVNVPEGVKVTLLGDAVINSAGAVSIAGEVSGDCVAATVNAGGDLTMTGTLSTSCADTTQSGGALTLASGGELNLDGATLVSSGDILITNEIGGAQPVSVRGVASVMAAEAGTRICLVRGADIRIAGLASHGADGSPVGARGFHAPSIDLKCDGKLTIEGGRFRSQAGGPGGKGTSTTAATAVGGNGGDGGDIRVKAGGDVFFGRDANTGNVVVFIPGQGGFGGNAMASGKSPAATGGDAGREGLPFVETPGRIVIVESGALTILWDFAFGGGDATAQGDNGADATGSAPAERGIGVVATGGRGSTLGFAEGTTHLIGDLFKGTVENGNDISIQGPVILGASGHAVGMPGNGGRGNETFPDGGEGGTAQLTGGQGNSTTLFDDRHGQFVGTAGRGGDILFGVTEAESDEFDKDGEPLPTDRPVGTGGAGWSDCKVGALKPGGRGGDGGKPSGIVGQPGWVGTTPGALLAAVHFLNLANGGAAGSGTNAPAGGAAGSAADVIGLVVTNLRSFEPGADGGGCAIAVDPAISVESDANGHAPFIGLSPSVLQVTLGENNEITVTGNGNWVTVTGTVDASGNFTATGSGTVAGFANVPVSFSGALTLDGEGRAAGIQSGQLTMDSTNSNLPANGAGQRNPAVYSVTGSKIG